MKKLKETLAEGLYQGLCLATIFAFIVMVMMFCSCSHAQNNSSFSIEKSSNYIMFDFSLVDDAIYDPEDGMFTIEYDDPDAFDYENLAYLTNRTKWYGEYIHVDIEDSLIFQFLLDWKKHEQLGEDFKSNWEEMDSLSKSWGIQEVWITFPDGSKDVRYDLIFVGRKYNWYE